MKAVGNDWFEPAMQGSLHAGFERLLCIEEQKLQFVRAIKQAIVSPIPHGPDRLSVLHEDVRNLEKSLRLRLDLLPIDRPQAWFRHSPAKDKSPIAKALHEEPIFARFEESRAASIGHLLPDLWKTKQVACPTYDPTYSIWGRLLLLNKKLQQLNQLGSPFQDIHIDEFPDAVPDELQSPSLAQFCFGLAQRMRHCQRDLETCYALLWSRSETFLLALHRQHMKTKSEERRKQGEEARKDGEERQRTEGRPPRPIDEALRFMNFGRLPAFGDLRQRYRTMAQSLHPDRGGNEERFKALTAHYQVLLKQLQRF